MNLFLTFGSKLSLPLISGILSYVTLEDETSFDLSLQHNHDEIGLNLTSRNEEMGGPYLSNQDKINEILSGFRKMKKLGKNVVDTEDIEGVWGFAFEDKGPNK